MKLLRYGPAGQEQPGLLDAEGRIRSLSGLIAEIDPATLAPARLQALKAVLPERLPLVEGAVRLGVPVAGIGKLVAIGLNYSDHANEAKLPIPTEPIVFMKATSCISGPNDDVIKPPESTKMDWEVELGIVIGKKARAVSEAQALEHVAGYCVVNDVSERAFQFDRGGSWDKGKSFDTFGPIGPYLVTPDEIEDIGKLGMWLEVNGTRMQTGNTSKMIFSCAQIISYVSKVMTLYPGDVIATGTPPGVGMGMTPPRYLEIGDVMRLGIDQLGMQRQRVVGE